MDIFSKESNFILSAEYCKICPLWFLEFLWIYYSILAFFLFSSPFCGDHVSFVKVNPVSNIQPTIVNFILCDFWNFCECLHSKNSFTFRRSLVYVFSFSVSTMIFFSFIRKKIRFKSHLNIEMFDICAFWILHAIFWRFLNNWQEFSSKFC